MLIPLIETSKKEDLFNRLSFLKLDTKNREKLFVSLEKEIINAKTDLDIKKIEHKISLYIGNDE